MPEFLFDDGLTSTKPVPANIFTPPPPPPKSKRQERKERKKAEWEGKIRLREAQRAAEGLPAHVPDTEVDFLKKKKKRQRETQQQQQQSQQSPPPPPATMSQNGGDGKKARNGNHEEEQANVKKRRKIDAGNGNEFPLLDGGVPGPAIQIHQGQLKAQVARLRPLRVNLPIWEHQGDIRAALREKDVLVMLGETGSGKSTQIGQFLVNQKWMDRRKVSITMGDGDGRDREVMVGGCIAITQPRRVAAINLARRVAQEMGCHLGDEVGYSVRFDNKSSEKTRIKFLTDGMLLQEMLHDPLLRRYSAVVVDEAHERTVGTDLVMGFLRGLVYGKRKGLKVIVMSATLEVEKMALFFEKDREGALAFIKAKEERRKGKERRKVVEVNGGTNGKVAHEELPNGIEEGKHKKKKKKGKQDAGAPRINGNPYDRKSDDKDSSPPLVNGDRKGSVEEGGSSNERSPEGPDSEDEPYDGTVAAFTVPGRQFPVEIYYAPESVADYVDAALRTVFQLHYGQPLPGDILVFLTGQEEIEALQKLIQDYAESMDKNVPKILVLPLYSALPPGLQQRVFQPAYEKNMRKVILSTNIAETSVTVPGVRHVVDCGKVKTKQYRPKIGLESLLITPVSKSSALQRTGRAGREAAGKCYRLYTEPDFIKLAEVTVPEILRCDVASSILTLKARGQEDVLSFDYLDSPGRDALGRGLEHLYTLGALDNSGRINELGHKMAKLPLVPALARVLIAAAEPAMDCLHEAIDIIAALSVENILLTPTGDEKREQMEGERKEFDRREGDHIMLLTLVREYESQSQKKTWAEKHFVSHRAMQNLLDVRKQLKQYTTRLTSTSSLSTPATVITPDLATRILKCFLKGFLHNTARLVPDGSYRTVVGNQVVAIHPSSVLFGKKVEAIVYHEFVYTTRAFARGVSAVEMGWVGEGLVGGGS
ncbi:P-loop containing nucleoside triphosphate hydrolase protein [Choiromyces venosus 120613-1]|uniref:RNA helicase n=1 Tax=Choiromyces venosus 120613-1 TaxID=1336337 RepID=A0A3N4K1G5_9PEZI|nr:P-loop containing nucleoside triphosphate hydrolase protein [Choiromyces venosus 120613-1]